MPEAKKRWSSYDADSYMGRSRQGQSAYLFSTKTMHAGTKPNNILFQILSSS